MRGLSRFIAGLLALCLALAPAQAGVLPLLAIGGGPATQSYQAFATEASGALNITYSSIAFGTAAANRVLVVVTGARLVGATSVSSVTIGGVAATHAPSTLSQNGSVLSDIWYASVPTGATGSVNVIYSANPSATGIQVYAVYTTNPTPLSSNAGAAVSGTSLTTSITVPASGFGIVGATVQSPSSPAVSGATLDNNGAISGGRAELVGNTSVVGPVTVGVTNGAASNLAVSAAAWGP